MRTHALRSSLTAVALLAACSSYEAIGSNDLANLGRTLQARAESTIGPGAADGPALVTRVIVTNVGDARDAISITGCTVLVRVDVMPPGGPGSVYDDGTPPCAAIVTRIDLAPGRADTLQRVLDFQTIGASATSGARLGVQARFAGLTLDGGSVTIP